MAELTNPLFDDEREFLERQKLEYERALQGDVDDIKEKTQTAGKYALIGVGLLGSIWLIKKAFSNKKPSAFDEGLEEFDLHDRIASSKKELKHRGKHYSDLDTAVADDLGFGSAHGHQNDRGHQEPQPHDRAHLAPDVYHTDSDMDPFPPVSRRAARAYSVPAYRPQAKQSSEAANLMAGAFQSFMQSDTGKMLLAQVTAVLMAYVAKKVGEYLPVVKNPDLATSPGSFTVEPETKDIDFTYHHDEADAPHQSA
ncbi:hypothetical protein [Hymenobacter chitinivorans]|uniref:Uncharacterized protein n=1 Tax=Hymenobacter chitinivorans DSM 11115 TaxID=1121954 RepID=A0A2M9ARS9_9BACT|nr:hypothetical protein [Hymenobacter chitinivorans]PJJ48390.1 hypothetical protein CLV45_4092 [Hymenobacter chitinivorans DSM 11115]